MLRTSTAFRTSGPHRGNQTSKKARVSSSEDDDEFAQRRNLELLFTAEEGTLSSTTYANLVKDTSEVRIKFIKQEANSSREILDLGPYLGKPSLVSEFTVCISENLCFPRSQRFLSDQNLKGSLLSLLSVLFCLFVAKIHPRRR